MVAKGPGSSHDSPLHLSIHKSTSWFLDTMSSKAGGAWSQDVSSSKLNISIIELGFCQTHRSLTGALLLLLSHASLDHPL